MSRAALIVSLLTLPVGWLAVTSWSAEPAKPGGFDAAKLPPPAKVEVDFVRDIQPLFAKNCYQCHGPEKQEGGLKLHRRADALAGGDTGVILVAGKSSESTLVEYVSGLGETVMPPKGERLTAAEVGLLRAWIDQGAKWPATADANPLAQRHWAYQPPVRHEPPVVKDAAWAKNAIDRFILARLEQEGLRPAPEADRARLIRRVSLDLTGLPPTPAEVEAFTSDTSPQAYENVVDRLLQSPAFGERWARLWLDLARYADSQGYEKDNRRTIWRYRDWVIDAFNRDLPFDQFTIEQLAGDMLPGATLDQRIATGFHRNTMTNTEGGTDNEEFRHAAVVDRVNSTFQIWQGTTFNCCQCHSHKYDPFTQREYYQVFAFLNNTTDSDNDDDAPFIEAPTPEQTESARQEKAELVRLEKQLGEQTPELDAALAEWSTAAATQEAAWTVLVPSDLKSAAGASLTKLDDHSVLAGGKRVETDTYTLTVSTTLSGVRALRLDVLADESLPAKGPGRAANGNFVITEFRVETVGADAADKPRPVALHKPFAPFSQEGFPVAAVIDGKSETGWANAARAGQANFAIFETQAPLGDGAAMKLNVTLAQQAAALWHTVGRFRISATTSPHAAAAQQLPEKIRDLLRLAPNKRAPQQQAELAAYYRTIAPSLKPVRDRVAELKANKKKPTTTPVMVELAKSRATHIHVRGAFLVKGETVEPGVPAVLNPWPNDVPRNRLGFARWLVDPANPLTARVTVNRFWEQFFGQGLVSTSEDFGKQGERPSHPELLDWLATEFVRQKWSMKGLHKTIVMSAAYRQSSRMTPELIERDPRNRWVARGPRFRLEAEMIRDQALAVSGLLSRKLKGASVMPPQPDGVWMSPYSGDRWTTSTGDDRYRRGLYTFWRRTAPYPAFMTFDAPSREVCVLRRSRSNTPLQALTVLNDPVYVEASQALARRMMAEAAGDERSRARHGFRACLSREPVAAELDRLAALFQQERERFRRDPKSAAAFAGPVPAGMDGADLAAWTVVANVLLNLDEMVTRG